MAASCRKPANQFENNFYNLVCSSISLSVLCKIDLPGVSDGCSLVEKERVPTLQSACGCFLLSAWDPGPGQRWLPSKMSIFSPLCDKSPVVFMELASFYRTLNFMAVFAFCSPCFCADHQEQVTAVWSPAPAAAVETSGRPTDWYRAKFLSYPAPKKLSYQHQKHIWGLWTVCD